jgi:hypothetical protein
MGSVPIGQAGFSFGLTILIGGMMNEEPADAGRQWGHRPPLETGGKMGCNTSILPDVPASP